VYVKIAEWVAGWGQPCNLESMEKACAEAWVDDAVLNLTVGSPKTR